MAKKPKTLETKLRAAIRLIWSRSPERRAVLKLAEVIDHEKGYSGFICPLCHREWPMAMAEVDHEPPLGTFDNWRNIESYIDRMFYGPQRAICKLCHRRKTNEQRKRKSK